MPHPQRQGFIIFTPLQFSCTGKRVPRFQVLQQEVEGQLVGVDYLLPVLLRTRHVPLHPHHKDHEPGQLPSVSPPTAIQLVRDPGKSSFDTEVQ